MHRHGARINKLGRERDQRRALVKGLATALVESESIETTLPKARVLVPYAEKLITKAKKGDLHSRRQVISGMATVESANKLVDEIAPKLTARASGHLRLEKSENRRGDNAAMARGSFVDDLSVEAAQKATPKMPKAAKPTSPAKTKSAVAKKESK